ncbi:UNVERIFIED_CONTAM: hypothetical protein K2H54_034478 [Gekko kuhli]
MVKICTHLWNWGLSMQCVENAGLTVQMERFLVMYAPHVMHCKKQTKEECAAILKEQKPCETDCSVLPYYIVFVYSPSVDVLLLCLFYSLASQFISYHVRFYLPL